MTLSSDSQSESGKQSLPDSFNSLSLQDSEKRKRLKRLRYQRLERDDHSEIDFADRVDQELLSTATDFIEIISKRRKINDSITSTFMTNIIDINKEDLKSLSNEEEKMNDVDRQPV